EDGDSDEASYGFNEVNRNTSAQVNLDFTASKAENKEIENFFISENQIVMNKNSFEDSLLNDCIQYVLGIGFEDRTYESLNKIINNPNISKIYALKHKLEEGRFNDIKRILAYSNKQIDILDIDEIEKIDYSLKTII